MCSNITITVVYYITHIYRKDWLTNRLNLPIILNWVLESSTIRTLLSLSPQQSASSLPLLNGLCCCCCLLPPSPPNRRCSTTSQPLRSCCRWFLLPPLAAPTYRAEPWFLLPCFCHPFSHHWDNNSFYRCVVQHSSSGLIEAYDHQLSLLTNADEVISSWLGYLPLCWWLSAMSSLSCFWLFWWFFFATQPLFSPLEATGSAYFERVTLLSFHGCTAPCGRLSEHSLCNSMGLSKIFSKVMLRLLCTCSKQSHYLMNWLLSPNLSPLKTLTSMYFVVVVVSSKTW